MQSGMRHYSTRVASSAWIYLAFGIMSNIDVECTQFASLSTQIVVNCSTTNEAIAATCGGDLDLHHLGTGQSSSTSESPFVVHESQLRKLFARASSFYDKSKALLSAAVTKGHRVLLDCCELLKLLREHGILDDYRVHQRDVEFLYNAKKPKYERKIDFTMFVNIMKCLAVRRFGHRMNESEAESALVTRLLQKSHGSASPRYDSPRSIDFDTQSMSPRQAYIKSIECCSVFDRLSDKRFFPLVYKQQHPGNSTPELSVVSPCSQGKSPVKKSLNGKKEALPSVFERLTNVDSYVGIHKKLALLKLSNQQLQPNGSVGKNVSSCL